MKCFGCISPPRLPCPPQGTHRVPHHNGQLDKHTFVHIYRQSAVLRLVPLSRQLPHGYGSSPPGLHPHATFRACGVSSCFELLFYTSATRRRPLVERQPVEELLPILRTRFSCSWWSISSFLTDQNNIRRDSNEEQWHISLDRSRNEHLNAIQHDYIRVLLGYIGVACCWSRVISKRAVFHVEYPHFDNDNAIDNSKFGSVNCIAPI